MVVLWKYCARSVVVLRCIYSYHYLVPLRCHCGGFVVTVPLLKDFGHCRYGSTVAVKLRSLQWHGGDVGHCGGTLVVLWSLCWHFSDVGNYGDTAVVRWSLTLVALL